MSIKYKHTIKAIGTNFELSCIFGLIITVADFMWLCHDILTNGFSITYSIIGSFLVIGILGIIFIIYRHNSHLVHKFNHQLLKKKVKIERYKTKHNT